MINKETKLPNLKPFVRFSRAGFTKVKLPNMEESIFQNQDLKKFYRLVKMIVTGKADPRLLNMKLPTIHNNKLSSHARNGGMSPRGVNPDSRQRPRHP